MVTPHRFKYDGIFSNELNMPDLITCVAFDSDNGDVETRLAREAVYSESFDGRYKRTHQYKYTETFGCTFTLTKSNFGDFTQEEVRATLRWLTQKDTTALLEVYYDDSNVVSWASIGGFVNISLRKLANNRTVAIIAEWDSIHPFCLSDLHTVTKAISSPTNNKITINIDTDDNKPVYPRVTINHGYSTTETPVPHSEVDITGAKPFENVFDMVDYVENTVYKNGSTYYWKTSEPTYMSATTAPAYKDWKIVEATKKYEADDAFEANTFYHYNGMYYWMDPYAFHSNSKQPSLQTTSVKLINKHTNFFNQQTTLPSVVIKNNNSTEVITLDGANRIISSSNTRRIFDNDFENWQWLELHDGKNEIEVLGNCKVTLQWREVRKVGEW